MSISKHNEALEEVVDRMLMLKHEESATGSHGLFFTEYRKHKRLYWQINPHATQSEVAQARRVLVGIFRTLRNLLWIRNNYAK